MIWRLLLVLVMLPVLLPTAIGVALVVCGRFVVHGTGRGSPYYRTSATDGPTVQPYNLRFECRPGTDMKAVADAWEKFARGHLGDKN